MAIGPVTPRDTAPFREAQPARPLAASRGFESVMARAVNRQDPAAPAAPVRTSPAPSVAAPVSSTVLRGVDSGEVRGSIAPAPPPPAPVPAPAAAAPLQFGPEDEAALAAWAEGLAARTRPAAKTAAKSPSAAPEKRPRPDAKPTPAPESAPAAAPESPPDPEALIRTARSLLGRPYVPGGESPKRGFDCSGLTSYVYGQSGLDLPRSSREQFREGRPVTRDDLKPGDLVFFGRKGVNHVGIYVDGGRFVHAASTPGAVREGSLDDPFWNASFAGARRLI